MFKNLQWLVNTGTQHIDALIHFCRRGRWSDEIDLKDLPFATFYVIDKSKVAVIQTYLE